MRKAGVMIGLLLIVAALIIIFFATRPAKEEPIEVPTTEVTEQQDETQGNWVKEDKNKNNTKDEQENKDNSSSVNTNNDIEENNSEVKEPNTVTETVVTKEISSVQTINESSLTNLVKTDEVLALISHKRVLLIDENPSGNDRKMLTYCFDVITPDNKPLVLFVTKSVYDKYKVQDRLKVVYEIYKNDSGVEFPIVSLVTSVE